jgi:hypothetical protein
MKRRTLLHWLASAGAAVPLRSARLIAQRVTRAESRAELTPDAISLLNEIAPTVLPSALGAARTRTVVDRFAVWVRDYQEGVALAHGYGHPRLAKSGPTPASKYIAQLTELDRQARARGGRWPTLEREQQRALLEAAFTAAGVRNLPQRPTGQHVVADLMALYFRSSEANDDCYRALIGRETCRTIAVTVRRPDPR